MSRQPLKILLVPLVIFGLLLFLFDPSIIILPITLCFGWLPASVRYWAPLHPNTRVLISLCLALAGLVVGAHLFLRWLYVSIRSSGGGSRLTVNWRWKWTLCVFGITGCSLLAIGCLILTTHQIYWISKSPDSILTDPYRQIRRMRMAALELKALAETNHWEVSETADAFYHQNGFRFPEPVAEEIRPVWVVAETNANTLRAVILLPQRPLIRSTAGILVIERGKDDMLRPFDELSQVLSAFGIKTDDPVTRSLGK